MDAGVWDNLITAAGVVQTMGSLHEIRIVFSCRHS